MSYALEAILGFVPLTESLRATTSGVPDHFPAELSRVAPSNRVLGDRAKFIKITGERRTAPLVKYGAPARRVPLRDVADVPLRMLHVNMEIQIDIMTLAKLQAFEQYIQDEGMDWLRYQIEEKSRQVKNTAIIAMASVLRFGAIYWDGQGNLLPSSSGAVETYSFQMNANNQNQLNGIISQPWSLTNTDIPGQHRSLYQTAAQLTGLRPKTALYGLNIPKYFQQNAYLQAYLARNEKFRDKFVDTAELPNGLLDIDRWIPVYETFFEDQNGTNQTVWDNDLVTYMPELNQPNKMNWWRYYEGSYPVPKSLEISADPLGALSNFEHEYGEASYCVPNVSMSPPGMTCYFLNTWLPGLANPNAIFQAETVF